MLGADSKPAPLQETKECGTQKNLHSRRRLVEVEGALVLESLKVTEDVGFDLCGLGFGVELLKFCDDLLDSVMAIAALDDFEAGAIQAEGAFRHEQHVLVVVFAEAAACSEARAGLKMDGHDLDSWGTKAPGGGQPGFTYEK